MITKSTEVKNIITIGSSAGGLDAVSRLLKTFNSDMDAAVFIVIHLSAISKPDVIVRILQKSTTLKCVVPRDQQEITNNTIYLAPPDHHMIIEKGRVLITKGATENHHRPSIDVLFRSAAATYSGCVTGIILTGLLDDGASGMQAIQRCGGRCMVQDPEEATFSDMPNSVLRAIDVDFILPISEMGYILSDLFSRSDCQEVEIPADIKLEADIARRISSNMDDLAELGNFTPLTCPDCGGALVKVKSEMDPRYRCYTGHTFTENFLAAEQVKRIEESLWVAIRMLEERKNLNLNMQSHANLYNGQSVEQQNERQGGIQQHIDTLRDMLLKMD